MTRVLTAFVLIPAVLSIMFLAPPPVAFGLLYLIAALCYHEYLGLVRGIGLNALAPWGYLLGLAMMAVPLPGVLMATVVAMVGMAMALRTPDLAKAFASAGVFSLGVLYVFGGWRTALDLGRMSPHWLLMACAINWVGDSAAMFAGRAFGKHKLAPRVSPGKTWEGSIASLLAGAAFGVAYICWAQPLFPWWKTLVIAAAGNAAGQLGDLAESALKRGANVKDSGTMLPGHGGWLDRVDSTLFAMPVVRLLLTPWL